MTITRGTPRRAAARQASSVCACTPSVALTTTTARSTLASAVTISPAKSAYPGVSSRFTLTPLTVKGARLVEMESWRATSSGSKSMTVVPFSTDPRRAMAPVAASSASASVVLPAPWCPTRATLRIAVGSCGTWSSVLRPFRWA